MFRTFRDELHTVSDKIRSEQSRLAGKMLLPDILIEAMVAAEDRRFHRHLGVDLRAVVRAAWQLACWGQVSGASTIEQQLVRTIRGRYEVTLTRKLTEMAIAIVVSARFEKRMLVEVYARVAYLGWGASGIEQAVRRLGLSLTRLTAYEASTLAAMLKLPMPRCPSDHYRRRLRTRAKYILQHLHRKPTYERDVRLGTTSDGALS